MKHKSNFRTWVEINKSAVVHNARRLRRVLHNDTLLMGVVKSNAYGHGITVFPWLVSKYVDVFGVDSIVEGLTLRRQNLHKPILVLGSTIDVRVQDAVRHDIMITVSTFERLARVLRGKATPELHIKLDTGMHRQGFLESDLPRLARTIQHSVRLQRAIVGIYTHFARAKTGARDRYTAMQIRSFERGAQAIENAAKKNLIRHAAATSGTIIFPQSHYNMVRVGIGLYGLWPSHEIEGAHPEIKLKPVLAWYTVVSEIKHLKRGDKIGYDIIETLKKDSRVAVLPVGYWHGVDRGLSSVGHVLIRGVPCKVLGRICMDMTVVDVSKVVHVREGDVATLIGKNGSDEISAEKISKILGTINYEVVTRINPLIERVAV